MSTPSGPPLIHPDRPRSTTRAWSGLGVPHDVVRETRARVQRLAFATGSLVLTIGAGWLLASLAGWVESDWILPIAALVATLACAGLVLICRSPRITDSTVVYVGLAFVVVLCGLGGFAHSVHGYRLYARVTAFGPFVLGIAMFPLLLPCPPRLTLITAALSATAVLVGVAAAQRTGLAVPTRTAYLDMTTVLIGCVALAYVVSRMLFRLQSDVANARRLGSYELEEKLGQGGMGEVWRARHRMLARRAAVKLIRPQHLADEGARQNAIDRFSREAQATAALESPHTVRLYDFGVTDEQTFYYSMELLDGIDLEELVALDGPQPPERVHSILMQVCDSLAEAHERGLVHRDIKPANIMLCRQGRSRDVVKVLDFGIVALQPQRAAPEHERLTGTGGLVGTPAFMAPEALLGEPSDARSDIYSVGCVAYWLLVGRRVFEAGTPLERLAAQLRDPVVPPSAMGASVPGALEAIVLACLAKRPEQRPQSADELAARLVACSPAAPWDPSRAAAWWESHGSRRAPGDGPAAQRQQATTIAQKPLPRA
jgi:serine/threonine-protein kinase